MHKEVERRTSETDWCNSSLITILDYIKILNKKENQDYDGLQCIYF